MVTEVGLANLHRCTARRLNIDLVTKRWIDSQPARRAASFVSGYPRSSRPPLRSPCGNAYSLRAVPPGRGARVARPSDTHQTSGPPRDYARCCTSAPGSLAGVTHGRACLLSRGVSALVHKRRIAATPELIDLFLAEGRLELATAMASCAARLAHASQTAGQMSPGPWRRSRDTSAMPMQLARPEVASEAFARPVRRRDRAAGLT